VISRSHGLLLSDANAMHAGELAAQADAQLVRLGRQGNRVDERADDLRRLRARRRIMLRASSSAMYRPAAFARQTAVDVLSTSCNIRRPLYRRLCSRHGRRQAG
jgi:phage-related minor tail protein